MQQVMNIITKLPKKVANALIWGQLECGGWNYVFDYAGENSLKQWYDTVGKNGWRLEEFRHYYGNATYDDLGTMMAAEFLLRMYVEKNDPVYKAPLEKVIRFVLESQYPSEDSINVIRSNTIILFKGKSTIHRSLP